jgi:hypothetical protein
MGLRPNWPPVRRTYAPEGMLECWNDGYWSPARLRIFLISYRNSETLIRYLKGDF